MVNRPQLLENANQPQFDGCEALERIQAGPVADLYRAVQQPIGRTVFIKALSSSILPSSPFAATLEREARLLADMDHPNLLKLFDFVKRPDRLWLVLEFVDGITLDKLLQKARRLGRWAAIAIALETARALEHAHRRGVIHRDVRPQNILVSRDGRVKLMNFAMAVNDRLPSAYELTDGVGFAGPSYMSPEQILGEATDARSDLFSLGIVLYEMVSHTHPFAEHDGKSTTQLIRHEAALPLSRVVREAAGTLERTVQRCLEKLAGDRFASTAELIHMLEGMLQQSGSNQTAPFIVEAMLNAGIVNRRPQASVMISPGLARIQRRPLWPVLRGHLIGFGLIVVGGGVIQALASDEDAAPARGGQRLELVPDRRAHLRVVADPWAKVHIDGQYIDTTPFAQPIPLKAGIHYITLEHPDAPTERRTVTLSAGETVLLDVEMQVPQSPSSLTAAAQKPAQSALDGGTGDQATP